MEGAAQPAILESSEREVGAAMSAMAIDQAKASLIVAKQHQVFTEQFHGAHRARSLELIKQGRRLPILPHQLAAWVFRPGAGDQVVLLLAHHGGVSPGGARTTLFARIVRLLNEWSNYDMDLEASKNFLSDKGGETRDAEAQAQRR